MAYLAMQGVCIISAEWGTRWQTEPALQSGGLMEGEQCSY